MLDLRLVRSFVAVAETEHVGHAARLLHISQSPLSRQIRQLEASLGLLLFHREKKRLRLTAAGRGLLEPARALIERAAGFEREAARRARGETDRLTIGCVKTALWSNVVQRAVREIRRSMPGVHVDVETASSERQLEALARGRIDVALVHRPPLPHATDLSVREILREPLLLALPRAHPLARKRTLRPSDLTGETWILLARTLAPELFDRFRAAAARVGLDLLAGHEVSDRATQLAFVASGLGIAFVPASAEAAAGRAVVLRPVAGLTLDTRLLLVHHRGDLSLAVTRLVAILGEG